MCLLIHSVLDCCETASGIFSLSLKNNKNDGLFHFHGVYIWKAFIVGNFSSPPFPNPDSPSPTPISSQTFWQSVPLLPDEMHQKQILLFADDLRHCIKAFPSYLSTGISFHNRGALGIIFEALKSNRNSNADIFFHILWMVKCLRNLLMSSS